MDDVIPNLQKKFGDKTFSGQTNYEDLVQYLIEAKSRVEQKQRDDHQVHQQSHEIETRMEERRARHRSESRHAPAAASAPRAGHERHDR